jgi:DNA-directed RNA polymerase
VAAKLKQETQADERQLVTVLRALAEKKGAQTIALAILQTATHQIATEAPLTSGLVQIGQVLAGECFAAKLTHDNPRLAKRINREVVERFGSRMAREKAARALATRQGFKTREWGPRLHAKAGAWALSALLEALPDIFVAEETGKRHERVLSLTEAGVEIMVQAAGSMIDRNPVFIPLDHEPKPWTKFDDGGSWDQRLSRKLMRTYHQSVVAAINGSIRDGSMQQALDGLHTLQNVPYRINTRVLGVMRECVARDIPVKGLPKHKVRLPERKPDMTTKEFKDWVRKTKKAQTKNLSVKSEATAFGEDLATAEKLATWERFWTPMHFDFRGRVYGMSHFNFQRGDHIRALFLFADGEPIGEEGLYWLKVHVANCGEFDGVHKRPFDERVKWVDDNFKRIEAMTWTPMTELWWTKTDKPFLFLAAAIELCSAVATGPSYVTRLPVSFDGSCSGLQHLCAMTKASEGSLVNLTPNSIPQDVYQTVATKLVAKLKHDAEHGQVITYKNRKGREKERDERKLAKMTLDYLAEPGVSERKFVKRGVMTFFYSSKEFGMRDQLIEDFMKPLDDEVTAGEREFHPFGEDEGREASKYLARHLYHSIKEVAELPAEAMGFLQSIAQAMAHEGKPATWRTPAGMPWINKYHKPVTTRVSLWLSDHGVDYEYRVKVAEGYQERINKKKAANAIAPNFVHALDSAHLLRVVNAARAEGITSLATVHDSFGCLASRAGRFRDIIREEFVRMYEQDVLAEILEHSKCALTVTNWHRLPKLPEPGSLDLKEVLNAEFAFA